MLKREESNTYLTHISRHHCSGDSRVKRWNIRSFQPRLWLSSAVDLKIYYLKGCLGVKVCYSSVNIWRKKKVFSFWKIALNNLSPLFNLKGNLWIRFCYNIVNLGRGDAFCFRKTSINHLAPLFSLKVSSRVIVVLCGIKKSF